MGRNDRHCEIWVGVAYSESLEIGDCMVVDLGTLDSGENYETF